MLGINRKTAAEFSFILAVPTIFGATVLDITQTRLAFSSYELSLLAIGFVASFIFAFISIKWLINYLQNHSFVIFGVYRIILAIVFYLVFLR
jgi:undecaprenyl-diphosphatase